MKNQKQGCPPIYQAINDNNLEEVKRLIEEEKVEYKRAMDGTINGWTPLRHAKQLSRNEIYWYLGSKCFGWCPNCGSDTFTIDESSLNMDIQIKIEYWDIKVELDNFRHEYLVCAKCDTAIEFHPENAKKIEVDFKF